YWLCGKKYVGRFNCLLLAKKQAFKQFNIQQKKILIG
ncbi:MAG: hypothetical protein ACI9IJ_002035, partial [Psychromonas sp.]